MNFLTGRSAEPFFMMQGGAGPMDPSRSGIQSATDALRRIAEAAIAEKPGAEALEFATRVLIGLEDEEQFNAGYGAALQADGQTRLSAALMDGRALSFSAVICAIDLRNPSRLALALQKRSSKVLTDPGAMRLARQLGLPPADLVTPRRFERWLKKRAEIEAKGEGYDTVGVVYSKDGLVAGTSTGGRGYEMPGRVSDSGTVAGNYASEYAAISMTGIGEQIVDYGVAVRIETRVRDGMSLKEACERTYQEAIRQGHEYGWVACDRTGNYCAAHTTEAMSYLVMTLAGEELLASAP